MQKQNSPFWRVLEILKAVGGEMEFEKLLKYSNINEKLLKLIIEVGFWGVSGNDNLWITDKEMNEISISSWGTYVLNMENSDFLASYDDKLNEKAEQAGIDINIRIPQKIDIKSNLTNAEPQFVDDNLLINPALTFLNDTIFLTQKIPVNVTIKKNDMETLQLLELPALIYYNGMKKGMITIDKIAMETMKCDGVRLKNIPMMIKNRWSLNSIKKFLEDMLNDDDYSFDKIFPIVRKQYEEYMEFTDDWHYDLFAIWCMGTYFHEIFQSFAYIYLNALKRSGKSKCLTLTGCMAFNAINALTMTPSSLFRVVDNTKATLLIDEIEKINKKDEGDLRSLLLAGYKKGFEVPRVEEKKNSAGLKGYSVPSYDVFSCKMLANISGIEDILSDRAITIIMQRGNDKKKMNMEVIEYDEKWQEIRDKLYVCLMFNAQKVNDRNKEIVPYMDKFYAKNMGLLKEELEEKVVKEEKAEKQTTIGKAQGKIEKENLVDLKDVIDSVIKGRAFELWRPIFTIASLISDELLLKLLINAVRHEKARREEDLTETLDSILVELLLQTVKEDSFYRVKDIAQKLKEMNPDDEKWLNTRWVTNALKRLGLVKERKRHPSGVMVKINVEDVKSIAKKIGIIISEPIDILKKPERKNQNEEVLNLIEELGMNGGEIHEDDLISKLKDKGVTNAEQRINQLKQLGILFSPTPNVLKKV